MKLSLPPAWKVALKVAPFVGAWIEIVRVKKGEGEKIVAPFVGAWIEILL